MNQPARYMSNKINVCVGDVPRGRCAVREMCYVEDVSCGRCVAWEMCRVGNIQECRKFCPGAFGPVEYILQMN